MLVDGIDLRRLDLGAFRRQLGFVPQEPFLFSGTIRDNIAYGRPDATDAEVERRRGRSAPTTSSPLSRRLPAARCSERGARCRPARRQLICLARARARRPSHPDPRRGDRRTSTSATEARVQRAMGVVAERPHHAAHRPPAADGTPRRPHPGHRRRPRSSSKAPTTSCSNSTVRTRSSGRRSRSRPPRPDLGPSRRVVGVSSARQWAEVPPAATCRARHAWISASAAAWPS